MLKVILRYLLSLESNDFIFFQIVKGNLFSFRNYVRMFFHEQPTDVSEEEPVFSVVRIGVGFAEFVMYSVIPGPFPNGVLESESVEKHKEDTKRPFSFVGLMGPQSVSSRSDSKSSHDV